MKAKEKQEKLRKEQRETEEREEKRQSAKQVRTRPNAHYSRRCNNLYQEDVMSKLINFTVV